MNSNPNLLPKYSTTSPDSDSIYQKMIEDVEDYAILMVDTNGYVIKWNKGAEKIKGYQEHEIISKHFRVFYTKEDQQSKLPERLLEVGKNCGKAQYEGWRVRKDGSKFWGSVAITALYNDHDNLIGFSKLTRDLTERKIAEDRAKEQADTLARVNQDLIITQQQLENKISELNKANKDLEHFAYIASHDLQEPLRKITTYFSMICHSTEKDFTPKNHELKDKIRSSTKRMQTLINDLLTLSTLNETPGLTPVNLNKVLEDVLEDLEIRIAETKAIIEIGKLPEVMGIESYLIQLFLNFLSNALKFSTKQPVVKISAQIIGSDAVIKITDNGIGMDEKNIEKIFEPFQRLHAKHKYEGTGIGLTICKKIVDTMNGKIAVESQVGIGTTFIITLTALNPSISAA